MNTKKFPKWMDYLLVIFVFVPPLIWGVIPLALAGEFAAIFFLVYAFVIWIVINFSAKKCWELANRIGRKGYVAFFIGLFFSLLGLLFYWIYYLIIKAIKKKYFIIGVIAGGFVFLLGFICIGLFFMIGIMEGGTVENEKEYVKVPINIEEVPIGIKDSCIDYCKQYDSAENHYFEQDEVRFICYCIDSNSEVINTKKFPR